MERAELRATVEAQSSLLEAHSASFAAQSAQLAAQSMKLAAQEVECAPLRLPGRLFSADREVRREAWSELGPRELEAFTETAEAAARRASEENKMRADRRCVVCWSGHKTVVFSPCRHLIACADCAAPLQECPICRAPIAQKLVALFG